MKNLINYLRSIYNSVSNIEIDSRPFRREIYAFLTNYNQEFDNSNINSIESIKTFENEFEYIIQIVTKRPGMLIGKAGHYIDSLKTYLQNEFPDKEITIDLKESVLWHRLYSA